MAGAWCNLASGLTAEMAAIAGFDWVLIDQEHGPGDSMTLLQQVQAIGTRPCAPITRIAWNEMPRFKQALDLGSAGIMIPYVETAEDAAQAVLQAAVYMGYPGSGLVAKATIYQSCGYQVATAGLIFSVEPLTEMPA